LPDVGRGWTLKEKRGDAGALCAQQEAEGSKLKGVAGSRKKLGFILAHIRVKLKAVAGYG
jgi:hypothetical protein